MRNCTQCGGRLERVHRRFSERLRYMAIFQCQKCDREECVPRPYTFRLGEECRCPVCGTYRVSRLKERDKIDRMHTGLFNFIERVRGGSLYSCCFCRLQFYDRRKPALRQTPAATPAPVEPVTAQADTASSGA